MPITNPNPALALPEEALEEEVLQETLNQKDTAAFPNTPPFPTDVPTAPLHRISLSRLHAGKDDDGAESARLFAAARTLGFFYLDLRGDVRGEELLCQADRLFKVGEDLFALGGEELGRYDYSQRGSYFGYKGYGSAYVDDKGTLDRNEFYNAPKDDFLSQSTSPLAHPPLLLSTHAPLLRAHMRAAHAVAALILTRLTTALGLPDGMLTRLHALDAISGDHVRFIKAPPQPATAAAAADEDNRLRATMGQHTDFGSVTILFNRIGGLQVRAPAPSSSTSSAIAVADAVAEGKGEGKNSTASTTPLEWLYVKPLPGHCIVNLGDAMVAFTNGLLRSSLHRVVAPPGEQARCTRYALVYFARPADEVPLRRIDDDDDRVGGARSAIPPLASGVVEEGLSSREHIMRMALGKRVVKVE